MRNRGPFRREKVFSKATCISLLSIAEETSMFVNVAAFSSHRFFEKVKTTTGSKDFLRK
jgi:hypothetical protein